MRLVWNIVLAFFWSALWGKITLANIGVGFFLSYFTILLLEQTDVIEDKHYGKRLWRLFTFVLFFTKELMISNIQVAIDVLRISPKYRPAIIKIPLDLSNSKQITLLANVITLTPGTLTLDVSEDEKFILVHTMFYDPANREGFVESIKLGFEQRIKELFE